MHNHLITLKRHQQDDHHVIKILIVKQVHQFIIMLINSYIKEKSEE